MLGCHRSAITMQCVLSQCVSLKVTSRGVSFAITDMTEQHFAAMTKTKIVLRGRPVTFHLPMQQMPLALEFSVAVMLTLHSIALLLYHLGVSHGQAVIAWWLQIGEVRQQVVEAHRRCSDQQATIVQLHQRLLDSQQDLQAKISTYCVAGASRLCLLSMSMFLHGSIMVSSSYKGSARIMGEQVACRKSLVSCIRSFWAPETHHSSPLSGRHAMMTQPMCAY